MELIRCERGQTIVEATILAGYGKGYRVGNMPNSPSLPWEISEPVARVTADRYSKGFPIFERKEVNEDVAERVDR